MVGFFFEKTNIVKSNPSAVNNASPKKIPNKIHSKVLSVFSGCEDELEIGVKEDDPGGNDDEPGGNEDEPGGNDEDPGGKEDETGAEDEDTGKEEEDVHKLEGGVTANVSIRFELVRIVTVFTGNKFGFVPKA